MLRLIPAPLHRLGYRIAHALRKVWWRVARPTLHGVRVLALDAESRVLLVRHSYGTGRWMPPGGGLHRGEAPTAAAQRELREEVGLTIEQARDAGTVEIATQGTTNVVRIVVAQVRGTPRPDCREIVEARFFALDALPDDMAPAVRSGLPGWITAATAADRPEPALPPARPPAPTG